MYNKKNKRGFSIGEVMVAMFILLVGIVDAIYLTVRSVGDLHDSRDAVIATLLAQEGTELVRNVRDNNVTQSTCGTGSERCTAFDQEYGFPSITGSQIIECTIDYNTGGTDSKFLCNNSPSEIYLNTATGMYTHQSGGNTFLETGLRRKIYIEYDRSNNGPINAATPPDEIIANVTSVVVFGGADFPTKANIEKDCMIAKGCVYAQTRLTSWINYGD
ncbi:MAG: hypothetical protein WC819_02655 [Parcubacteria group bacterium]